MTIDDYCKNPSAQKDLPEETKIFYDSICLAKKSISKEWDGIKGLGKNIPKFLANMLEGIFTPAGLEMLGKFMGVTLGAKVVMNAMLRCIARGAGEDVMKMVAEVTAEKGGMYASNAVLSSVLKDALEEGSMAARAFSFVEGVGEAVSIIMIILLIVQLIGGLLDTWDPEGYNQQLDADHMDLINSKLDDEFIPKMLPLLTSTTDQFGRTVQVGTWPVEFYADYVISDLKSDYYSKKHIDYVMEYIDNLAVNSNGEPIAWPKGGEVIQKDFFERFSEKYSMMLSDQNTVVSSWLNRNFIIVIGILFVLIIFLLVIK